jgi:hypothetical protein
MFSLRSRVVLRAAALALALLAASPVTTPFATLDLTGQSEHQPQSVVKDKDSSDKSVIGEPVAQMATTFTLEFMHAREAYRYVRAGTPQRTVLRL